MHVIFVLMNESSTRSRVPRIEFSPQMITDRKVSLSTLSHSLQSVLPRDALVTSHGQGRAQAESTNSRQMSAQDEPLSTQSLKIALSDAVHS